MRIDIGGGVRLYVDIEGCGLVPDAAGMREKPTLICMHGGPGFDHSSFKPAFSQLADAAQVVYYDHRGHGRSDRRPREEWNLDTWADDIVRLCEALGIDKPIVLGQSFGGMVAQKYLARHPGHPGKVVISSTSPRWVLQRKLEAFKRKGGARARAAAEAYWTSPSAQTFQAYWDTYRDLYNTRPDPDAMGRSRVIMNLDILLDFAAKEIRTMDLAPGLAKAQCPVLVMAGEEDPICNTEDAKEIVAALPKGARAIRALPRRGPRRLARRPAGGFHRAAAVHHFVKITIFSPSHVQRSRGHAASLHHGRAANEKPADGGLLLAETEGFEPSMHVFAHILP